MCKLEGYYENKSPPTPMYRSLIIIPPPPLHPPPSTPPPPPQCSKSFIIILRQYLKEQLIFSHRHYDSIYTVQRPINLTSTCQELFIVLQHFEEGSNLKKRRISTQLMPCSFPYNKFCNFQIILKVSHFFLKDSLIESMMGLRPQGNLRLIFSSPG